MYAMLQHKNAFSLSRVLVFVCYRLSFLGKVEPNMYMLIYASNSTAVELCGLCQQPTSTTYSMYVTNGRNIYEVTPFLLWIRAGITAKSWLVYQFFFLYVAVDWTD